MNLKMTKEVKNLKRKISRVIKKLSQNPKVRRKEIVSAIERIIVGDCNVLGEYRIGYKRVKNDVNLYTVCHIDGGDYDFHFIMKIQPM